VTFDDVLLAAQMAAVQLVSTSTADDESKIQAIRNIVHPYDDARTARDELLDMAVESDGSISRAYTLVARAWGVLYSGVQVETIRRRIARQERARER
jgi:hypothetical protein